MLGSLILDLPHLFWSSSRQDKLLWYTQIKYVSDKKKKPPIIVVKHKFADSAPESQIMILFVHSNANLRSKNHPFRYEVSI